MNWPHPYLDGTWFTTGTYGNSREHATITKVEPIHTRNSNTSRYILHAGDHSWATEKDAQVNHAITPDWEGRYVSLALNRDRLIVGAAYVYPDANQ